MASRSLFARSNVELSLADKAPDDVVDLLVNTVWGSPGGTLYRHLNTPERIHRQHDPYFLTLHKSERLLGILGFSRRTIQQPSGPAEAFYIRYLSMMSSLQRQSGSANANQNKSDSLIKKLVNRFMSRPINFSIEEGQGPEAAMFYAFVELENERSMEMCRSMDFSPIGKFSTLVFSRFNPKADPKVRKVTEGEKPNVLKELRHFYREHALFSDINIFYDDNYFVLEENGEIVAGLQANPCHWVLQNMPGFSGKLIMKVLPHIPLISRIFNPKAFKFIALEGVWFKPGHEKAIFSLMESALHHYGLNSGLIWLDENCPVYNVMNNGPMGLLRRFHSGSPVDVIARFSGVSDEIKTDLAQRPLYISSFDST